MTSGPKGPTPSGLGESQKMWLLASSLGTAYSALEHIFQQSSSPTRAPHGTRKSKRYRQLQRCHRDLQKCHGSQHPNSAFPPLKPLLMWSQPTATQELHGEVLKAQCCEKFTLPRLPAACEIISSWKRAVRITLICQCHAEYFPSKLCRAWEKSSHHLLLWMEGACCRPEPRRGKRCWEPRHWEAETVGQQHKPDST